MSKGCIEWEHSAQDGLVLRIKPGLGEAAATAFATAAAAAGSVGAGEVVQHAKSANREILLAVRGLVDIALQHMDEKTAGAHQQGTKIKVE